MARYRANLAQSTKPSVMAQVAADPMVFALGVGVANGVLAAVRNKPVSQMALYATVGVLTAGELILVAELPPHERPDMKMFALKTALGVFTGMAPFVAWEKGEKSMVQRAGEALANKAPQPQPQPQPV